MFECPICKRETPVEFVEKHHLTPKQHKGRKKAEVCCDCHDTIHQIFTNKELAKKYNNIDIICRDERIIKWAEWISKKDFRYKINMKRKKKR